MPFPRQTLSQLRTQTKADINAALPGADALLRYSNMGIIGDVVARMANDQMGYLDWIAKQATPFTATDEFLEAWAALKGVYRKAAVPAAGIVSFAAAGGTVPAGTPVSRGDGASYVSTADATAAGNSVEVPVAAVTPGSAGSLVVGTSMTLGLGISGVSPTGDVTASTTPGADIEQDDALRTRMLKAYAAPAQGGSSTDYEDWALAVPGVTRAWQRRTAGIGTVTVYVMLDEVRAAFGGFPQGTNGVATDEDRDTAATGDQLAVADALFVQQPVTPIVYVVSPLQNQLTLTIAGLSGASAMLKSAIVNAVTAALLIGAEPGGVTNVSLIEAAINGVAGSAGFVLTNIATSAGTVTPGNAGNVTSNTGCLAVLAGIVWA